VQDRNQLDIQIRKHAHYGTGDRIDGITNNVYRLQLWLSWNGKSATKWTVVLELAGHQLGPADHYNLYRNSMLINY